MLNKTIKEFSEIAASKSPVPGGGGVSANVAALASSLGEMVTNLTIGKEKYLQYTNELADIKKELDLLRTNLLDCINKDAEAFEPLSVVYKMDKNDPTYSSKMEECLKNAAKPPLLILKYCSRIIDLDERLAVIGSKISVSDAATSVMLAHGAMYGAYVNTLVNTRLMKDKEYALDLDNKTDKLVNDYSLITEETYNEVLKRLTNG